MDPYLRQAAALAHIDDLHRSARTRRDAAVMRPERRRVRSRLTFRRLVVSNARC